MKNAALLSSLAVAGLALTGRASESNDGGVELPRPGDTSTVAGAHVVELAICLDTSGSMDGLIDSARQKLWTIVNDLAKAEPTPRLRVALLSYGNDGHHEENGWVKVETPFTEDLDTVSKMLFGLTTNGGTELVGRVVQTSLQELDWHASGDALRMIFVAGNESADQDDRVAFRGVGADAAALGIDVSSIYCDFEDDDGEVRSGWRELARKGNGEFAKIDQDHGTVVIATPFDQRLLALSAELNETYIPFGDQGAAGCSNQAAQDANAAQLNVASAASRAATKATKLYSCGAWDLVDAVRDGRVDLATMDVEDLPEEMRALTHEQRAAKVEAMQQARAEVQGRIQELDRRRQELLDRELARPSTTNVGSFDVAIRDAIRTRAEAKGFAFDPIVVPTAPERLPVEAAEEAEYFVRVGSGSTNTWVTNDLVTAFVNARQEGGEFTHDVHVAPGTDEAKALLGALPTHLRELVGALTGALYLRWNDKVYLVAGGC